MEAQQPRPRLLNSAGILAAAHGLVQDIKKADLLPDGETIESTAGHIAKVATPYANGYELAKDLEQYHFWTIDVETVEVLDGWSQHYRIALQAEQLKWSQDNNIVPEHEAGTRVSYRYDGAVCKGTMIGVYDHGVAQYIIDPDVPLPHKGRPIINFEDVTLIGSKIEIDRKQ